MKYLTLLFRVLIPLAFAVLTLTAHSAPLPSFSDPNMQACFDEQVVANNWQQAEDVDSLSCSDKAIEFVDGIDQLPNLQALDLSHNPIVDVPPLFASANSLRQLDLSGTRLFALAPLFELQNLTHLHLNDIAISDPNANPAFIERELLDLLNANPGITHLGINGIKISDHTDLFNRFSPALISLEIANIGLNYLPVPFENFQNLQVLDLSSNPLNDLPPLSALSTTLRDLNVGEIRMFDLSALLGLQNLEQLILNDLEIENPGVVAQQLLDLLRDNPSITHLGANGITLSDPISLFNELSQDLVALELGGTGLEFIPVALDQFTQLELLDVSHNPLADLPPLYAQSETLKTLKLDGVELFDLSVLAGLQRLKNLSLNDILFTAHDASVLEQQLLDIVRNNPAIRSLGINGLRLNDPSALLNELSPELVSLQLANTGLTFFPIPLEQFTRLRVLDVSANPLDDLPPLFAQTQTLERLNLAGISLYDLAPILALQNLSHLSLDKIRISGVNNDPVLIEQQLLDLVRDNRSLRHLNVNGIAISNPSELFNELSVDLVALSMSNTGLNYLPTPFDRFTQLRVLDLSENPLTDLPPLYAQSETLKELNLSGIELFDLSSLIGLQRLTHLVLNNVSFENGDPAFIEQQLLDLVRDNPSIIDFGINGITLENPDTLLNELSTDLVTLELSAVGLDYLSIPLDQYGRLQVLDLSANPLVDLPPLFGQSNRLEQLNLSGTELFDLSSLLGLQRLTHLLLNNVTLTSAGDGSGFVEQQLLDLLRDNPGITHLGINGFAVKDATALFNEFSSEMISLEVSNIGLNDFPLPLDQFARLQVLDLSANPLTDLPPLFAQSDTLQRLNISGIEMYDFAPLLGLQRLTHLLLNDLIIADLNSDPMFIENQLRDLINSNQGITHLGINGFTLSSPEKFFAELPSGLISLQLSGTGVQIAPVPLDRYSVLEILDLTDNGITDIGWLFVPLHSLQSLNLAENDGIACDDLDALAMHLGPSVELIRPSCRPPVAAYCAVAGSNTYYEWIAGVRVGNTANPSGNDRGYADYTGIEFTVVEGETVPLTVQPGFGSTSYVEQWSVWIDYNQDGEFDPSEQVLGQSSSGPITVKLAVPAGLQGTSTRMRVAMRFGGTPTACGRYPYGEVEDYTLTVTQ